MKYRSKTDIIHDILLTVWDYDNGALRTKIMYNAFLSYAQVKEYVGMLTSNGLLQYDSYTQKFRVTQRGRLKK